MLPLYLPLFPVTTPEPATAVPQPAVLIQQATPTTLPTNQWQGWQTSKAKYKRGQFSKL